MLILNIYRENTVCVTVCKPSTTSLPQPLTGAAQPHNPFCLTEPVALHTSTSVHTAITHMAVGSAVLYRVVSKN